MIAPGFSPPDISTLDRFVKITTAAKLLAANYQSVTKLSRTVRFGSMISSIQDPEGITQ